jgi:hypothetical protein
MNESPWSPCRCSIMSNIEIATQCLHDWVESVACSFKVTAWSCSSTPTKYSMTYNKSGHGTLPYFFLRFIH